jgi:hypothetical protein
MSGEGLDCRTYNFRRSVVDEICGACCLPEMLADVDARQGRLLDAEELVRQ